MQQNQKTICEKCFIGIIGIAWVAGLLIAGSDNTYMPWLNGVGLILFFGASILLGKFLESSQSDAGVVSFPKFYQKPAANAVKSKKKNQKINIQYVLGIQKEISNQLT